MSNYSTEINQYKGHNILAIKDSNGKIVLSFGIKKAKAILECLEEVKEFVNAGGKSNKINLNDLSKEQIDSILGMIGQ
jgi:hypothetical protein